MSTKHMIPELNQKGLRHFGFVSGSLVAAIFGVLLPLLRSHTPPMWPWAALIVLAGLGLLAPRALKPIYYGWMRFGLIVSGITTPLILGIVFFLVITPMALIKTCFGRDPLARKFDEHTPSYRVRSVQKDAKNLERPF